MDLIFIYLLFSCSYKNFLEEVSTYQLVIALDSVMGRTMSSGESLHFFLSFESLLLTMSFSIINITEFIIYYDTCHCNYNHKLCMYIR